MENTIDELKTHLLARKVPIRSLKPREVVQEVYGLLLAHWAVRCLIVEAAEHAQISPLRLGFTGTLQVLRRAVAKFQSAQTEELPFLELADPRNSIRSRFQSAKVEATREWSKSQGQNSRLASLSIEERAKN